MWSTPRRRTSARRCLPSSRMTTTAAGIGTMADALRSLGSEAGELNAATEQTLRGALDVAKQAHALPEARPVATA